MTLLDPIDLVAEQKLNRFFRARKKLTQSNVISHITQRVAGKDPCFVEDDDFLCMLGFLKESAQKHDYEIFSFCLMGNHAHLLLRPNQGNLQSAMRDLFSRQLLEKGTELPIDYAQAQEGGTDCQRVQAIRNLGASSYFSQNSL